MRIILTTLLTVFSLGFAKSQEISGEELLSRAIAFHDPSGNWQQSKIQLIVYMQSPDRPTRRTQFTINNRTGAFNLKMVSRGDLYEYDIDANGEVKIDFNFMPPVDSVQADTLNLKEERALFWRNYYSYLYGLPMKLKDPGAKVDPKVTRMRFLNEEVLALKVTYDASVGKDTWYFYFNPETYAMVGYRFYHDEAANDGEYIVLNGLEIQNGLRIPKDRTWYTNAEGRLLGTDYFIDMKVND